MSAVGNLFDKVKAFIDEVLNDSENEARVLAEAATPVLEHLRDDIVADVKADVTSVLDEFNAAKDQLAPLVEAAVKKVLTDAGILPSAAPVSGDGQPPASV